MFFSSHIASRFPSSLGNTFRFFFCSISSVHLQPNQVSLILIIFSGPAPRRERRETFNPEQLTRFSSSVSKFERSAKPPSISALEPDIQVFVNDTLMFDLIFDEDGNFFFPSFTAQTSSDYAVSGART